MLAEPLSYLRFVLFEVKDSYFRDQLFKAICFAKTSSYDKELFTQEQVVFCLCLLYSLL